MMILKKLIVFGAALFSSTVLADVFSVNDIRSFEKCLQQDHLMETVKSGATKQSKFLDKLDIQVRCIENATSHLSKEKNPSVLRDWIKVAFNHSHHANSIDLLRLLANSDRNKCNDEMIYKTLLDIFSGPKSDDKKSLYQRGKTVALICLKDPTFKKDFLEEQESTPGSYQFDAVCDVLKSANLIKDCKK